MQMYQLLHHYRKNAFYAISDLEEQKVWHRELTFHRCGFYRVPGYMLMRRFRVRDQNADVPDIASLPLQDIILPNVVCRPTVFFSNAVVGP
eukprot:6183598-Pleurochrysis_carterae.AAC.1